jgi:cell cycle serine/threonine-protein kinase CDC5/MSD2
MQPERGMEWVVKYLTIQNIAVSRLTIDILQVRFRLPTWNKRSKLTQFLYFSFSDYSKFILSSQGLLVTHIDKNYRLTRWPLSKVIATSLRYAGPRGTVGMPPE